MDSVPLEVEIYVAENGKAPFSIWFASLKDSRVRAAIRIRIGRIRLGNFGDCKPVGDGVYELRIAFGPGYRVYYGRKGNRLVILLCGGHKGSQKRDVTKAKQYWVDCGRKDYG